METAIVHFKEAENSLIIQGKVMPCYRVFEKIDHRTAKVYGSEKTTTFDYPISPVIAVKETSYGELLSDRQFVFADTAKRPIGFYVPEDVYIKRQLGKISPFDPRRHSEQLNAPPNNEKIIDLAQIFNVKLIPRVWLSI